MGSVCFGLLLLPHRICALSLSLSLTHTPTDMAIGQHVVQLALGSSKQRETRHADQCSAVLPGFSHSPHCTPRHTMRCVCVCVCTLCVSASVCVCVFVAGYGGSIVWAVYLTMSRSLSLPNQSTGSGCMLFQFRFCRAGVSESTSQPTVHGFGRRQMGLRTYTFAALIRSGPTAGNPSFSSLQCASTKQEDNGSR